MKDRPRPSLFTRRTLLQSGALTLAAGSVAQVLGAAMPDAWPTKPVRLLVGSGGGSSTDLVARALADPLSRALGQPVIVDNRPGASGNIAADLVAKATDQHTLGMLINGNMTIAKLFNPATPFEPSTDFAPLSLICVAPLVLCSPVGSPGADPRAFLAAARAAGGTWSYGTPGMGTLGHLGMEVLKERTGIDPVQVPYPGNPQVINALLSGEIQLAFLPPGLAATYVKAGKLRVLGVAAPTRSTLVPDYPTLDEAGVPGVALQIWTAAAAPASLPKPIVARLSTLFSAIARSPKVHEVLFQDGYETVGLPADALAARIKADTALLGRIITSRGIRAN